MIGFNPPPVASPQTPAASGPLLLRGAPLKEALLAQIPSHITALATPPHLAVVMVGDNPASQVYVTQKQKSAQQAGLACTLYALPAKAGQEELHTLLANLARAPDIHGILLQLPLPEHLQATPALALIPAEKDVDGLTPASHATLVSGARGHRPATPLGVMRLLASANVALANLPTVVVGRSKLVGEPLALLLQQQGVQYLGTVHRQTPHPSELARQARLLCVAAGRPGLITPDWVQPGALLIDVGLTRAKTGLLGDISPDAAAKAGMVTPVPGGVGPLTVATLLTNTVDAAFWQAGKPSPLWTIPSLF